jgi:FAD binding domain
MQIDLRNKHAEQVAELTAELTGNDRRLRVRKKTISNLFRYADRDTSGYRLVDLGGFNQPLYLDSKAMTLEVQGLTTFEAIVDYTLKHGLLPLVTPELKHITIGGAIVGIGIETTSYRHGFVHEGLLEADVLLADGRVVVCGPTGEHAGLFHGLPNSYGTLGYILRAKIRLRQTLPFVRITTTEYSEPSALLTAMREATVKSGLDYVECMLLARDQLTLGLGRETADGNKAGSIYGQTVFHRLIDHAGVITLPIKDYVFRYDPEWFWALPEGGLYDHFRRFAPLSMRNSGFYARYNAFQKRVRRALGRPIDDPGLEILIQDWEVPWNQAEGLIDFAFRTVDFGGKPVLGIAIKTDGKATNYPMDPSELYFNLGSYFYAIRKPGQPEYHYTKQLDDYCYTHGGIKMLYSSTFLPRTDFERIYGGSNYAKLKSLYDPAGLLPTSYDKAVRSQ